MNNIFSYYTKYRDHIDEYNKWNKDANKIPLKNQASNYSVSQISLKQKAKAIAEPLILLDSYEHEKAEDSETFFQTLNIELMSITGAICSIPLAITKLIPFFNKHSDKNNIIKKVALLLEKYNSASVNILGKNIPVPKLATVFSVIGGAAFYINGMKNSMKSQLGLIRKASFDGTQNIVNDPKLYAVLTPEQEAKVNSIVDYDIKHKTAFVDKLKDKVNINSSFQSVGEYKKTEENYLQRKKEFFEKQNQTIAKRTKNSLNSKEAQEDKILYENLLKNVEHDVLEPLRKVETISNISYSALFTGGFLEYLISDKLVDVLGIKNKILSSCIKIGVPLLTYLLLNKNISDFENKAILATKYKHLKNFTENPEEYQNSKVNKEENLFKFMKTTLKDMKDYDEFSQTELPKIKARMDAKRQIELTPEQMQKAKNLQENTSMVINKQREHLYDQSVGIETLSETILGPIDIAATAIGGTLGSKMAKKCGNKKLSGLLTGLGAIIAFIPAAIIEAKLTKQQKLSEKIAAMLAIKEIQNHAIFENQSNRVSYSNSQINKNTPYIFAHFN